MPLQVMSSYFVYKKIPLSGFFKVFLYLPSLISSIVMTIMFKYFVDGALPAMLRMMGMQNVPNFLFRRVDGFPYDRNLQRLVRAGRRYHPVYRAP